MRFLSLLRANILELCCHISFKIQISYDVILYMFLVEKSCQCLFSKKVLEIKFYSLTIQISTRMSSSRPMSAGRSSLQERLDSLDTSRGAGFISERPRIQNEINMDPILEKGNRCIQEGKISDGLDSYTSSTELYYFHK